MASQPARGAGGRQQEVSLTAELIESFAAIYLSGRYDDAQPTPDCHREWWELYCGPAAQVAIAAPRGHAKSTALTHDYVLALVCFRVESHVLVVSATEELSLGHLGDIAKELRDNEELREAFLIERFIVDSKGEIVVRCKDRHEFRIIARGSGQKLRGLKWHGRRPGAIVCDDMEEDEQVENKARRDKFLWWVMRALMPLGRRGALVRWHGTILHEDAMLARLMKDPTWVSRLYRAHTSFDDFSNILWEEMWPESRLREKRDGYIAQGDPAGYSQEYLNDPLDHSDAFLRKVDFLPMNQEDREAKKLYCAGADFAISKADRSNRTSFTVGGKCARNLVHVVDQLKGKWNSLEIVEEMFSIQQRWSIAYWFVEGGQIWNALEPIVRREMQLRDKWLNLVVLNPTADKATRGRSLQKRHRGGGMRFDTEAEWYSAYEDELLRFTGAGEARLDDQFDSTAILSKGFDKIPELEEEDLQEEDEWIEEPAYFARPPVPPEGRSRVTGY